MDDLQLPMLQFFNYFASQELLRDIFEPIQLAYMPDFLYANCYVSNQNWSDVIDISDGQTRERGFKLN